MTATAEARNILLIEPFYSGSHKVLMDLIYDALKAADVSSETCPIHVELAILPGKKWHWRARTSALHFSQTIPVKRYTCVFASCVLPLHELVGLRLDIQSAKKIIYFHENQLVYPVRKSKDRDFQYGYNQILSCLAADQVWFNSDFNRESFLSHLHSFFKLQPDFRPKNLRQQIEPKCHVKYFPLEFNKMDEAIRSLSIPANESTIVQIVWPHRWEFDKNPEMFFRVIYRLVESGTTNFKINVLGENFTENPEIFSEAQSKLDKEFIGHFGYLATKEEYYKVLAESNIAISTSTHEFFGVAMMEATYLGCTPICPNDLVYPELYKKAGYLYKDENDLYHLLKTFIMQPSKLHEGRVRPDFSIFDWETLRPKYLQDLLSQENCNAICQNSE